MIIMTIVTLRSNEVICLIDTENMIIMIIVTLCRNDSLLSDLRYAKWPTRLDCAFELSDSAPKQA